MYPSAFLYPPGVACCAPHNRQAGCVYVSEQQVLFCIVTFCISFRQVYLNWKQPVFHQVTLTWFSLWMERMPLFIASSNVSQVVGRDPQEGRKQVFRESRAVVAQATRCLCFSDRPWCLRGAHVACVINSADLCCENSLANWTPACRTFCKASWRPSCSIRSKND